MKLINILLVLTSTLCLQAMEQPIQPNKASIKFLLNSEATEPLTEITEGSHAASVIKLNVQPLYTLRADNNLTLDTFKRSNNQLDANSKNDQIYIGYFCAYGNCTVFFKNIFTIRNHVCSHLGIKPYKCPAKNCNKKCGTSQNLRQHLKQNHKDQPHLKVPTLSKHALKKIDQKVTPYIKRSKDASFREWRAS